MAKPELVEATEADWKEYELWLDELDELWNWALEAENLSLNAIANEVQNV
tara:strand:+ start:1303 stop:1452 length:150 start_codon:yes stop_codon:yes gene_type:complete